MEKMDFMWIRDKDQRKPWVSQQLTTSFDLFDVVAREPAGLAVKRSFPPASLLLPRHLDDVALVEA